MKSGDVMFDGNMDQLRRDLPSAGQSLESLYLALMRR
jgi:hypothetical protein